MKAQAPREGNGLLDKFCGSLLGGMVGDMIGAVVEAESAAYIRKTFQNLDQVLALKSVPELFRLFIADFLCLRAGQVGLSRSLAARHPPIVNQ
jgi:hypothetical protein